MADGRFLPVRSSTSHVDSEDSSDGAIVAPHAGNNDAEYSGDDSSESDDLDEEDDDTWDEDEDAEDEDEGAQDLDSHWLEHFWVHAILSALGFANAVLITVSCSVFSLAGAAAWTNLSYASLLLLHSCACVYTFGAKTWCAKPYAKLEVIFTLLKIFCACFLVTVWCVRWQGIDVIDDHYDLYVSINVPVLALLSPRFCLELFRLTESYARLKVSKKKKRYQENGFDLDLSYITPRIIAMGFPAIGPDQCFRNPMSQVQRFLSEHHPESHKVYNLCSEESRRYDTDAFYQVSEDVTFPDHNPCALTRLRCLIEDIHDFLEEDPENVVAVHCKAGKGRTGLVISCLLMREGLAANAAAGLEIFGRQRTKDGKGVTIPSQVRYVGLYETVLREGQVRSSRPVILEQLRLHGMATVKSARFRGKRMWFEIYVPEEPPGGSTRKVYEGYFDQAHGTPGDFLLKRFGQAPSLRDSERSPQPGADLIWSPKQDETAPMDALKGDFQVVVKCSLRRMWGFDMGEHKVLAFWLHSGYVPPRGLELSATELDGVKKKKHDFPKAFRVSCLFGEASNSYDGD
eukprot:TRINITY_DN10738_c0_g1_i3.p1 TRINITY_DN10738_c0_g1~~TRINITY_DN10738_c0_g1_i3.p1  ORF type:complete len:572 (+),score=120.96 TRINITY_DN10738_c0_g1_i3:98-1813(+)